ncbi:alkaline phosphatase [Parvularcula marina]|uniref:alkaline phosphatase D family protein n=1 Tax=Parvularcula marina TaxID=2292771 RepID=UPI003517D0B3
MRVSRRQALMGTLAGGLSACASTGGKMFTGLAPATSAAFRHGVASGDPARESVVLWTRVTTEDQGTLPVTVEIASDPAFGQIIRTIATEASPARDYTVKVVPEGLEPGRTYFYRFLAAGETSPTGRTRTLPENTEAVKFAVMSCSNYPFGYFNAYDHMARRDDIDAMIHLGDYIYEYSSDAYGGDTGRELGRDHSPLHEIVTLDDYRKRHAQYKADPGSRAAHAMHPIIPIWDDHETSNNSWEGGAQNHQPDSEGTWDDRRTAALIAYYEWMPVREPEPGKSREALFRDFDWGGFLSLSAIETRLFARGQQLEYSEIVPGLKTPEDIERFKREVLNDPSREMMGRVQLDYFEKVFKRSVAAGQTWRVVANQIIMARVFAPNLKDRVSEEKIVELEKEWDQVRAFIEFSTLGLPYNLDAWDGYPAARERFYNVARSAGARDLIVLTGDTHEAWGNDLYADDDTRMGVELGTTSVTSPGGSKYLGTAAFDYSLLLRKENRDVRFHDPLHHGYFTLELNGDEGRVDYVGLSTILSPQYEATTVASLDLIRRGGSVEFGAKRGLGFKERVVFAAH